ncbi:MAG: membrane protein insertase YidC [Lachnospiraceae bacterium]|nr:membrane protein insertase YidC [Lachnospiraceae bacterium]
MSAIVNAIVDGLVWLIGGCYSLCHNYYVAIFLFTLLTKVILIPLSVMVQKNSIKTVRMQPEMNHIKAKYMGNSEVISEEQYKLFQKEKYNPFLDLVPLVIQLALLMGVVEAVKKGTDLTNVPIEVKGLTLIVPLIAGISAFLMCYSQNKSNVLQAEQGALNQYGTMAFSVLLSLYLGLFVPVGVGVYWIFSNLLSIVQLFLLNIWINPKKYIDYEALEESKEALRKAKEFAPAKSKVKRKPEHIQKEKEDYKRFLSVSNMKIVFYSEKNGFYKYYKNIIEEIIKRTNIVVHYITGDPEDAVFAMESEQFKPYYIGENKLIVLMMKLEAEIVVMTTPDLENYHLKRSYIKKDAEYIYVPHDVNSSNLTFHKDALDHFDTIFTSGPKNKAELAEREVVFALPKKNLIEWGSGVIDDMIKSYEEMEKESQKQTKTVLIAPSWQKDNIMDSCIEQLLDELVQTDYKIIVRPHPQYVRHYEERIDALSAKYQAVGVEVQKDFSSNKTVYMADMLITDWSSIAFEYSFSTLKPVLFINTPMKVVNPDYQELKEVPIDIELRDKVGISLELSALNEVNASVDKLLNTEQFAKSAMEDLRNYYIYNIGNSGKVGAKYIIERLMEKSKKK